MEAVSVPLEHGLVLAALLFSLGLIGVMVRRNLLFILMSLEIMLNSTALAFIMVGARWAKPDGQVMFMLILTVAAAEAAVALALVIAVYRHRQTVDVDRLNMLRS